MDVSDIFYFFSARGGGGSPRRRGGGGPVFIEIPGVRGGPLLPKQYSARFLFEEDANVFLGNGGF